MNSSPLVIHQHAEEAAVHWLRRELAVSDSHYNLKSLTRLDDRIEANIDGLRVGGRNVWNECVENLPPSEPADIFPMAVLAWESGKPAQLQSLLRSAAASYECSRAVISSLGWLTEEQAVPHIERLLAHSRTYQRRMGIAACAVRGRDPGEALNHAVGSEDKLLQARALRTIGELARHDLLPAAKEALRSRDLGCKFSAAWSVARLTVDPKAIEVLKKIVESQASPHDGWRLLEYSACFPRALQMVLRKIEPKAVAKWLQKLAQNPRLLRQAIIGAGIVGAPDAVPWLLSVMSEPELARVASEAFSMITGVDLAAEKLEGNRPLGFESGPTDDPADESVALDEDENLPWPDVAKVSAWWEFRRHEFAPHTRYLCGKPLTDDWLALVLRQGYQRQRAAAALELAIRSPSQPLFNVRAPGRRQQQWLGVK